MNSVAVDVGGTFTDVCVLDDDSGDIRVAKVPSTSDPLEGVLAGVEEAGIDLSDVRLFSHGTTVATNALITRRFPPAAMVTSRDFRDVIEIRRGTRDDLWDAYKDVAPPYIRRRDRFEVTERVDFAGEVVEALDEDERARGGADPRAARGRDRRRLLHQRLRQPGATSGAPPRSCARSSTASASPPPREVLPEIFEHERFSTTVANAVLSPLVGGYVSRLADELEERGYKGDLLLLHSGGGVMTPRTVEKLAVRLAASGIAAGAIAVAPHRRAVRPRERDRARHGRHQHRHLARLRGRAEGDEGVVDRVRLSDPLPEHRGADDRRRRRLAGLDRRGRLAAQRPAVGGRRSRARQLRPRRRGADQHRRQPACSAASGRS